MQNIMFRLYFVQINKDLNVILRFINCVIGLRIFCVRYFALFKRSANGNNAR